LPALFFKSGWFAFISPLPLFILTLRNRPWVSVLALITNLALLSLDGISGEMFVAGGLWVGIGILFPLCIRKLGKIHQSFGISFLFLVALLLASVWMNARHAQLGMVDYVRSEITMAMDHLINLPDSPVKQLVEEEGRDALYRKLMTELPSGILVSLVFCLWINLLFASQLVKGFLSRSFWANYRNPEWLIFPTLLCGALFAFAEQAAYSIGLNGLKLLMTFYAFQGLSVISHALNRYKILGIGRGIAFAVAVFIVPPLVLALGFFDLWFDFRKKVGHS
jgi:uncharacterized protein YybS (DUF2232 family)